MQAKIERTINLPIDNALKKVSDELHSVLSLDIDECIVLVGKKHLYKFNVANQTYKLFDNYRITSILTVDGNNCYSIVQKNVNCKYTQHSGLKLFNLKVLVENDELYIFDIESTIVARNSCLSFSEENQRLIYMKNFETFHILPPLHRTTIGFIGMLPRDRYLAVKKIRNKFLALDKNNRLTKWNALTGRLEHKKTITSHDYS